ncbi:MAG: 1-deoxy-D-xylulose-5-phosphate reductoisomerase [Candidatus Aminicenantes bacterium RBG_19FT_COMBO_58_17]|jgi:1-deoxy-D-xylulose-5-phosphate reductoisomerase|nr:MAG: 1-deoxy-D-xylulose-5-phosphate reductoisomerase [Candidatus Aminicenantes bacterium RBG_19FT_COMBO_58_17]
MKKIAVLGSTGSIGTNTLEIAGRMADEFAVVGLAAGSNTPLLHEQVRRFCPKIVSLKTQGEAARLRADLGGLPVHVVYGPKGAEEVARFEENDVVVAAISGIEGLRPTIAAVETGVRVALANKETMVVAGAILKSRAASSGAEIIPVDSEHSGIFQCLAKERREDVRKAILTASGGPFFRTPLAEIKDKTVEEALTHPRWKMGRKVTIDSATLMNKGLELIEARWLFGLKPSQLDILIHPQSIVHSLVEMRDGSTLAQLSITDMRVPIQYALTYPGRQPSGLSSLELSRVRSLEFFEVEEKRYPLIAFARQALEIEKSLPVALNAANEVAVEAFLKHRIGFAGISAVVAEVLERHRVSEVGTLEAIFAIDRETRAQTENLIKQRY